MNIKELRRSKHLTQAEASALTGIPLRTFKSYENEARKEGTLKYRYILQTLAQVGMENKRYFPLFIDSAGRKVLLVGAGRIARRRLLSLANFDFDVHLVAMDVPEETRLILSDHPGTVHSEVRAFEERDLEGAFLALACTDDREVNRRIGELCRERGIPVSVCDAAAESSFWFPALAITDDVTVGIVGEGGSHVHTKETAASVRDLLASKQKKEKA